MSRDVIGKDLELTDVLEPSMFDSHKEVVNSLFEVYHDLGTQYVQRHYFAKLSTKIADEARERVREKYGLTSVAEKRQEIQVDIEKEAKELMKSFKQ